MNTIHFRSIVQLSMIAILSLISLGCGPSVTANARESTQFKTEKPIDDRKPENKNASDASSPVQSENSSGDRDSVENHSDQSQIMASGQGDLPSLKQTKLFSVIAKDCSDVDLSNWDHPTKAVLIERGVEIVVVKLCNDQKYPVFYVNFKYDPQGQTKDYFRPLYSAMKKENGDWPFSLVSLKDQTIIHISGSRSRIVTEFEKYQGNTPVQKSTLVSMSEAVEFSFMLRDGRKGLANIKKNNSEIVRVGTHPCGAYASARVTAMPDIETQGDLIPDKVVEVDVQDNTLRRWAKPVDAIVLAVSGDRILVDVGNNQQYWIDPSGQFELQSESISVAKPKMGGRAKGHPEFEKSGYAFRSSFLDLKTGNTRRIIYEASCT